jgi:hypothetical protein
MLINPEKPPEAFMIPTKGSWHLHVFKGVLITDAQKLEPF